MSLLWIGHQWQCIFLTHPQKRTPWKGGPVGSKKAEEELANCKVVYLWFIEKYPDTGMTVDLFHSPLKPPPWKGAATGLKNAEEELAHCSVVWFIDKYPDPALASNMVRSALSVETRLKLRFPKCLPISFELLEFLAQSTSPLVLTPMLHQESLLVNDDYTPNMPLIWFSGIVYYSQTLAWWLLPPILLFISGLENRGHKPFQQFGGPHFPSKAAFLFCFPYNTTSEWICLGNIHWWC